MNTTPKDRADAIRRLSEFNADGATEDDILCGIIRMEYYRIPYGPDAVRDRFTAFYRAAIGLFDDWKFVLSRAGLHVRPSRYFEPLAPDTALHSEHAYRNAVGREPRRAVCAPAQLHLVRSRWSLDFSINNFVKSRFSCPMRTYR